MELTLSENTGRSSIHPYKFALWLGCASLLMLFAALTSAYIVRQAAGNWLEFSLPVAFQISTATIVVSSLALHGAYIAFKRGSGLMYKGLLVLAALLGFVFLALQYAGWEQLKLSGVPFTLNPSGDFVYAITWLHAGHVAAGLAVLSTALMHAFGLPFRVSKKRKLRFELTLTYWHFVGALWIYLFFFLTMYR